MQMLLNASGEHRAGRGAATLGERPEQQPAAHFAGGVLDQRQAEPLGLGPEARNIAEILGVGGDLLEQPPGGFDSGEVLFALVFPAPFADQPVLAPDALNGHVADGQVELALQARGTEGGQLPSESENLLLDLGRGLPRRVMRSAAVFLQARRAVLPVSSPPLTDGEGGGEEEPCGGLDAPLPDGLDQSQAVVVGAFHFTDQIEVAGGHRAAILTAHPKTQTQP